jgi:hypothetical protein
MIEEVKFTCTALQGTGKAGQLPADADGYFTLPIGGLDCFNSANQFYSYNAAKNLFEQSSAFMRRVSTGCLKGEMGHPKRETNQSMDAFVDRVMRVEETRVSHHFSEIWLDFNSVKDQKTGRPIVAIMAKVKPSGPYGDPLLASLVNPTEDVCFSIRAFTDDKRVGGVTERGLKEIITWDAVTEPGIDGARKYRSPSLESRVEEVITRADLELAVKHHDGLALESAFLRTESLFQALGWDTSHLNPPKFMSW